MFVCTFAVKGVTYSYLGVRRDLPLSFELSKKKRDDSILTGEGWRVREEVLQRKQKGIEMKESVLARFLHVDALARKQKTMESSDAID